MGAIAACRTAALGGHVEACDDCGLTRVAYNSCRNRHCPKCQGAARAQWLAARQAELLPVPYFHVVFTLPAPIAAIAFQNKALVYAILFAASAEAMTTLAANPRRLGARIGGLAVLHTWGQTLTHHPHVHCIVPGGGLSPDGDALGRRAAELLPRRQAARKALFRRLFLERLQHAFDAGALRFFGDLVGLAEPASVRRSHRRACAPPPGSSTPRSPSADPPRRSPIWAATPTASPSPTAASSRSRRSRRLHLEGLSPGRRRQDHAARARRVHPALSPAHAARRLPPHPPLRLPRQHAAAPPSLALCRSRSAAGDGATRDLDGRRPTRHLVGKHRSRLPRMRRHHAHRRDAVTRRRPVASRCCAVPVRHIMRPAHVKAANLCRTSIVVRRRRNRARRRRSWQAITRIRMPKTAARASHLAQNRRPALAPVPSTLRLRNVAPTAAAQQSP